MVPMSDGDYTFYNIREGTHLCRFREAWGNFQKGGKMHEAFVGGEVGGEVGSFRAAWELSVG